MNNPERPRYAFLRSGGRFLLSRKGIGLVLVLILVVALLVMLPPW